MWASHALAVFLEDVAERGLDKNILLVLTGDFGRTPKINAFGGRDHWPGLSTLALAGGAVLTLNDGLVKALTADFPPGQVLALRGVFIYLVVALFAFRAGGLHTAWQIKSWKGQGLRGFCVVGSSFCFVTGLVYLPLADAISIAFAGPLFVTMLVLGVYTFNSHHAHMNSLLISWTLPARLSNIHRCV